MDAALSYLTARARTVGEMELYLYKQQFGEVEVYDCVGAAQRTRVFK